MKWRKETGAAVSLNIDELVGNVCAFFIITAKRSGIHYFLPCVQPFSSSQLATIIACFFVCLFICFSSCRSLSGYVISSSLSRTSRGTGKQNNAILNSMKDGGRCSDSFNCVGYSATFLIWFESNLGVDWLIFANFYSRPWQWPKILIL